jgi:hypothetical protein
VPSALEARLARLESLLLQQQTAAVPVALQP